jgi:hypothetical protein
MSERINTSPTQWIQSCTGQGSEVLPYFRPDEVGLELSKAVGFRKSAVIKTGAIRADIPDDHLLITPPRRKPCWISRAKKGDNRTSQCCRYMHRAAIVAEEKVNARANVHKLPER